MNGRSRRVALLVGRAFRPAMLLVAACLLATSLKAHNFGANPPTWNREISRLVFDRCASCHRPEGTAFSLMTYQEAQPRAVAIKDAVMARRMPPWGAVKGFGEFRNDQGLSQEQIELISDWVEGGMAKGNNPRVKPEVPKFDKPPAPIPAGGTSVRGEAKLAQPMTVDGIVPERVPEKRSMQIVAALPDGRVQPLVWLYEYRHAYKHPFLFRRPLTLPAGTVIRGLPATASIKLLQLP
jgi:mono/diheme cytochrome c family protein